MFLCYIDESGIPELNSGTTHFILLGLAIEVWDWREQDREVEVFKGRYGLEGVEIHTGWMARRYLEQERTAGFDRLGREDRRRAVRRERDATILRKAALKGETAVRETRKNFRKTDPYIHLTQGERMDCLRGLADLIGSWGHARLFAEATDKRAFGSTPPRVPPREEGFTQLVTRFQMFLQRQADRRAVGILVHDNNLTAELRLTRLMRRFHEIGTMWTTIDRIVETPFFVDSQLTGGVQLADLCAYATRRFFENNETDLFDRIYPRFDRSGGRVVGIRHYTGSRVCTCRVCVEHR